MANYTDSDAIAAYLGVTFTTEQAAQADAVAAAVTTFVDKYTGRTWQTSTPAVGEVRPVVVPGPADTFGAVARCYLEHAPVVTVDAVRLRGTTPNAEAAPLEDGSYELVDAAHGVLLLPGYGYGAWGWWYGREALAVVDYTYTDAVPADIALAATMVASAEMARQLAIQSSSATAAANPDRAGIKSVSIGQNALAVSYADGASAATSGGAAATSGLAPPGSAARTILDGYKRVVIA
jgi:hypothetical protein